MNQTIDIAADTLNAKPKRLRLVVMMTAAIFVAYTVTLWVALNLSFWAAVVGGAANTVPVIVFGALAYHIIKSRLVGRGLAFQCAGHLVLSLAFSAISFWFLIILLGVANGVSPIEFVVRPFPLRAMAWQMLENVTTYGAIAAIAYAQFGRTRFHPLSLPTTRADETSALGSSREEALREPDPPHYFTRSGEEIRPIDFDRVVCIAGADDYAEVTTLDGKHLVRMTLSEFENTLDAAKFARVHRSWIVNLSQINRAEPAGGGRMLLYMENGASITASRSGARLLRQRVI
jgi:hypothetical protein